MRSVAVKQTSRDVLMSREETAKHAIMGLIVSAVAVVGGYLLSVMNFITDPFLTPPLKATLKHLEEAELKTLQGDRKSFKAKSLWENTGAVVMAVRRPG